MNAKWLEHPLNSRLLGHLKDFAKMVHIDFPLGGQLYEQCGELMMKLN